MVAPRQSRFQQLPRRHRLRKGRTGLGRIRKAIRAGKVRLGERSKSGQSRMASNNNSSPKQVSPLAGQLAHLAEQAPHKYAGKPPGSTLNDELPEVDYFQKTWSRLSTGLRLQQSQRQVPENAGPLNSSHLIHRSLLLMQERSPGYLQHFLSYIDTLSWMEQLTADTTLPPAKPSVRNPAKPPAKSAAKTPARTAAKKAPRKAR
ncbi:DUF2894 domain-containing protein [Pusillimonas noertemannii]|nr:DUF2894 domain-containing protein [Pusillimonas noertemannii]